MLREMTLNRNHGLLLTTVLLASGCLRSAVVTQACVSFDSDGGTRVRRSVPPCWYLSRTPTARLFRDAVSGESYSFVDTLTGESAWVNVGERVGLEGHVIARSTSSVDCVRAHADGGTLCVIPGPGFDYFKPAPP